MATEKKTDKAQDSSKANQPAAPQNTSTDGAPVVKRRVGRPKGSKNKTSKAAKTATAKTKEVKAKATDATEASTEKPKAPRTPRRKKSDNSQVVAPVSESTPAPEDKRVDSQGKKPNNKPSDRRERRDRDDHSHINYGTIETVGGETHGSQGNKRNKRRRNRRGNGEGQPQSGQGNYRPAIDPVEQEGYAWKIFLGEVTEEGLAFMDDRAASDAARRAFRIAEIYLTEASRWANPRPQQQAQPSAPVSTEETPETIVENATESEQATTESAE